MSKSGRPLAYMIQANDPAANDMRPFAKITCAKCQAGGRISVVGYGNNPEWIEKQFIRLGWSCNVHKATECICPKCVREREIRAQDDLREKAQSAPARVLPSKPPGLMDSIRIGAGTRKSSSPMEDKVVTIKDLSPKQKGELRTAIEGYFDPDKGQWTDGYSDHRVSEELGIARVIVAEFRDTFYGELQEDPEIKAFRTQLAELKSVLSNLQGTASKMELKLAELLKKHGLS